MDFTPSLTSLEDFKREQDLDPHINNLKHYVTTSNVPLRVPQTEVSNILRSAHYYVVINDVLYRFKTLLPTEECLLLVVPASLVVAVIKAHHTLPLSPHMGIHKTIGMLQQLFTWPNMAQDVVKVIGSCEQCSLTKRSQRVANPELTLFEPSASPFGRMVIDLVGPLPTTASRFRYIAIIVDDYSRFVITIPLRTKEAKELVPKFYDRVICQYGRPLHLHSDMGGEFNNDFMRQLLRLYGIRQTFGSGYHSQSSGLAEAAVKRIMGSLRPIMQSKPTTWDTHLAAVTWSVNTAPVMVSGQSPFFLLHGFLPRFIYGHLTQPIDQEITRFETLQSILQTHNSLHDIVASKRAQYDSKMQMYYNQNKKNPNIHPGMFVYVRSPVTDADIGKKFSPYFSGPYAVTETLPYSRVNLRHLHTNTPYPHPVHLSRIKIASNYHPELAFRP